jgi:putative intracellular protease/amidase
MFDLFGAARDVRAFYAELEQSPEFSRPISWSSVEPADYDGLWLPGGHAPGMRQYLGSEALQAFVAKYWKLERPVAAICHGVLVLARARDPLTNKSILASSRTTCLPKYTEQSAYLATAWKLGRYYRTYRAYVEDEVKAALDDPARQFERGPVVLDVRHVVKAHADTAFAVEDGRYVSARWPGDAELLTRRFLERLDASAPRVEPGRALFDDVRQVCTVVDDFETTVENLVDQLGIGPFRCWHFRPPRLHDTTYRGKPASYSMKLAITWLDDMQWEVITPVDGPTLYRDHLERHGRGVQHLLMSTGNVPFEEASERLAALDHPFGQTAKLNAEVQFGRVTLPPLPNRVAGPMCLQFGYIDADTTLRTNIELTRYPLGLSERFSLRGGKAEYCIPEGNARFERPLPNRRVGRLVKIAIVTRDLDATIRAYEKLVGVGPWRVFERPNGFDARVAWARIGQALMELVQPGDGLGPYHEVLRERGEGVASLGVLPGKDGFDALVAHCTALGYQRELDRAIAGAQRGVYFGARAFIGTDLEVLDREPA